MINFKMATTFTKFTRNTLLNELCRIYWQRHGCVPRVCSSRISQCRSPGRREYSTAAESERQHTPFSLCRTQHNNPALHSDLDHGLFFTVDKDYERYYKMGNRKQLHSAAKAFTELALMVRQPAIEVFTCMRAANYDLPAVRYALYGDSGCGKSVTLSHVIHHCAAQDWLIVHHPYVPMMLRGWSRPVWNETHSPGMVDSVEDAQINLKYFMDINQAFIKRVNPVTRREYSWTRKDTMEAGSSWAKLATFALEKEGKYACDIVQILFDEIKLGLQEKQYKLLVALDGANAMYEEMSLNLDPSDYNQKVEIDKLTIVRAYKSLLSHDWGNGAVVCTVDRTASLVEKESYLPKHVLGRKGFEALDPFIPIEVPAYSQKEGHSLIEYLADRKFLTNQYALSPQGREELFFLSQMNPRELYNCTLRW